MTQISATWEVLPIERFLTNLTNKWLYNICEIYGGNGLYIQYTLHVPTEKPFLLTHRLWFFPQCLQTFCLLYSYGMEWSSYLNYFNFPYWKYVFYVLSIGIIHNTFKNIHKQTPQRIATNKNPLKHCKS